jgi:UDP-N-acetylglucosamine 2-epimerase (non-hydrolysing)
MKVMTIVGTRPEIIKLSRVMSELDQHVKHVLVHSGQNYDYELNEIFFKQLEIRKPDYFLDAVGQTVAETIGNVIAKSDDVMEKEQPNAVLLYGDTNSCLAVISAKRRKIPIFHMEAGNRCFDLRVPEEINRKIVDHTSDINMTNTEHARRYLLAEGIKAETVIKSGSPMKEVLEYYMPQIKISDALTKLDVKQGEYFVVSAHREENIDSEENFFNLIETLNAIALKYKYPIIFSTHPRTRKRLEALMGIDLDRRIHFLKPLGFFEYVKLQMNAKCVISDSGTITEESTILDFPSVTIRNAHERPEGMDEGTLIMCGLEAGRVIKSIEVVIAQHAAGQRQFRLVPDYDTNNVSKKVLRIIMSYTDYVNQTVWRKQV